MRRSLQIAYIILRLQFFIHNVLASDTLQSYETDTIRITSNSEWKCNSSDECTATNSMCNDDMCQCAPGYIYNTDMTACIRVATGLYDSCEETLQCSAYLLSGARCVDNVCVCGSGYYYLHGRCNRYVGLSEKCKRNVDCYVNADFEASTCETIDGICKCSLGFYQREYRTCRRRGEAVGDECTIDIDCTFSNSSYCDKFVCAIKSEIKEDMEFSIEDIMAISDIQDESIRVGSNCTTNKECRILGNAICGSTRTCQCNRAYFASDTGIKCIPELGEFCQNNDVININKSICRKGKWSCTNGTVASKDNRKCTKATRRYSGNCREDEQCYIFGPDAICNNKKCVCNDKSHFVENEVFCWGNKGVGETCIRNYDCYVKGFKGELICIDGTCDCPDGTHLNKNGTACIDSSTGLGGVCEADGDCTVSNSTCKEEVCICIDNYYQSNDQCLPGINSICTENNECAPKNSICTSSVCSCNTDYIPVAVDLCMPALSFGDPCMLDVQCLTNTPGAICAFSTKTKTDHKDVTESSIIRNATDKICSCSEQDHYQFGMCLKKKLLGESCTNRGECYVDFDQDNVICMNGKCTCNWGYVKSNSNVCLKDLRAKYFSNGSITNIVSTRMFWILLFVFFLIDSRFYDYIH